jgi:hypothetical protein
MYIMGMEWYFALPLAIFAALVGVFLIDPILNMPFRIDKTDSLDKPMPKKHKS